MKVRIDDIIVKRRIRADSGDFSELIDSIGRHGLMNPITVTEKLVLVAGFRRLSACRALGMEEIECRIVTPLSRTEMLLMEAEENLARKDLNPGEIERFDDERRFLQATGLTMVRLWFIRLFRRIMEWIRGIAG